jgi:hypothetical protein
MPFLLIVSDPYVLFYTTSCLPLNLIIKASVSLNRDYKKSTQGSETKVLTHYQPGGAENLGPSTGSNKLMIVNF